MHEVGMLLLLLLLCPWCARSGAAGGLREVPPAPEKMRQDSRVTAGRRADYRVALADSWCLLDEADSCSALAHIHRIYSGSKFTEQSFIVSADPAASLQIWQKLRLLFNEEVMREASCSIR